MKKTYRILASAIAVIILLIGSAAVIAETVPPEASQTEAPAAPQDDAGAASLIDEAFLFNFKLDGKDYQLPFPVADLLADGWAFDESTGDRELNAPTDISSDEYLTKDSMQIRIRMRSFSESKTKYKDSHVVAVFSAKPYSDTDKTCQIETAGGIDIGTAADKLEAAFGVPTIRRDYQWIYGHEGTVSLQFEIDTKENVITSVSLNNVFHNPAPEGSDGIDAFTPYDVAMYVPAAEMSERIADQIVSLGGKILRFPCPLSELLADGWQVLSTYRELTHLEPGAQNDVFLRKGNATLECSVVNLSHTENASLESAYIQSLSDSNGIDNAKISQNGLTFTDDVKIGTERKMVVLLLIDLKPDVSVSGNRESYNVRCGRVQYEILLHDGVVSKLSIRQSY